MNTQNEKNIPDMLRLDATGEPIEIGMTYGYSRNANGFGHVVIGKAKHLTSKGVTLDVIQKSESLYDNPMKILKTYANTVNVRSDLIFPLPHLNTQL